MKIYFFEKETQNIPYVYPISGWRDQLKEYNGEKFEYDNLGNPTTYRNKSLVWSHGRQLDKFADIAEFTYNSSGIRTSKIANGFTTNYYLNGNKIVRQHDSLNILDFYYDSEGITGFHIVSKNIDNSIILDQNYYYKKNLQGDIIGIIDSTGEQIVEYAYDAWGKHKAFDAKTNELLDISSSESYINTSNIIQFIAIKNPFRYRGYYYDFETGLYYLNSRYYDPETGRFINADDVSMLDATQDFSNGLNLYAYCLNNPINTTDEDGNLPNWLKWLIGGLFIVVGIIVSVVTAGTGTPIIAAIGSALLNTAIQVGISMAVSIGVAGIINIANNRNFFDNIEDTLADGFMWGGIFAGGSQILSGGFKGLAKLGVPTGKHGGIAKTGIFSPDRLRDASEIAKIARKGQHLYDYGGTILKFTKNFHIDVSTKSFLHLSFNLFGKIVKHFPLGAILGGIIGGF